MKTFKGESIRNENVCTIDPGCSQCGVPLTAESPFCPNCGGRSYFSSSFRLGTLPQEDTDSLKLREFMFEDSNERDFAKWTVEADFALANLGINHAGTTLKTSVVMCFDLIYKIYNTIEEALEKFGRPLGSLNLHRRIYKSLLLSGKFALAVRMGKIASIIGSRCYSTQADYALMLVRYSPSDNSDKVLETAMNMLMARTDEDPSDPEVHAVLGTLIASTFRWHEDQNGALIPLKCFDKSLNIDGAYLPSFLGRAMLKIEMEDFDGALGDLSICQDLSSESPDVYILRALLYNRMGKMRSAIKDYDKVIQLDPFDTWSLINRAGCYINVEDKDRAKEDILRCIEIDPYFTLPYNNLSNIQVLEGDLSGAIQTLSDAVSISPTCALSFLNLSRLKAKSGEVHDALSDLVQAMRLAPNSWDLEGEYLELVDRVGETGLDKITEC